MKDFSIKGAVTEIYVPWNSDFSIDLAGLEKEIEFQVSEGINGIFVNGMGTEALLLSPEQAIEILRQTVRFVRGRVPVMANVFHNPLDGSLRILKGYEEGGADAICITQPFDMVYEETMLRRYFETLIRATKLPVYIYNAPQAGYTLSPSFVAGLANDLENVRGYKDSTQNMIHLQSLMNRVKKDGFEYMAGSDGTILPTIALGGHGVVSFISTVFPRLIIDLCDSALSGDLARARELNARVLKVRDVFKLVPDIAGYKYAADLRGIVPGGRVIPPLADLTEEQKRLVKDRFTELGML